MPDNFDEKPIKPASKRQALNKSRQENIDNKTENDNIITQPNNNEKLNSYVNPHDEKPVGNSSKAIIDDLPIKPKAKNFEELLEKELRKNPHAAVIEDQNIDIDIQPKK